MPDDYEYYSGKRPDKIYISKAFNEYDELVSLSKEFNEYDELASLIPDGFRKVRIISKVFDSNELHGFMKIKDEVVLRVTEGGRQEVKIVFYEDNRDIKSITIQRYTKKDGRPLKSSFTFQDDEITKLFNLIRLVKYLQMDSEDKERFDDRILDDLLISDDEKRRYFIENQELFAELARNNITKSDITALGYRKEQLKTFGQLLQSEEKESAWQQFFEQNPWIFGYGLNYIFTSNLDNQKLERITNGYSVQGSGKRIDALMRTRGLISSLCFVEIKTHRTLLLSKGEYRPECWHISNELAGSIAQIQKTVQKSLETIQTKLEVKNKQGDPTGEIVFLYQPRTCVVIGSLNEFYSEHGINENRFSCFELFRRNMVNPEIITFDELFERAKFIVRSSEEENEYESKRK